MVASERLKSLLSISFNRFRDFVAIDRLRYSYGLWCRVGYVVCALFALYVLISLSGLSSALWEYTKQADNDAIDHKMNSFSLKRKWIKLREARHSSGILANEIFCRIREWAIAASRAIDNCTHQLHCCSIFSQLNIELMNSIRVNIWLPLMNVQKKVKRCGKSALHLSLTVDYGGCARHAHHHPPRMREIARGNSRTANAITEIECIAWVVIRYHLSAWRMPVATDSSQKYEERNARTSCWPLLLHEFRASQMDF